MLNLTLMKEEDILFMIHQTDVINWVIKTMVWMHKESLTAVNHMPKYSLWIRADELG